MWGFSIKHLAALPAALRQVGQAPTPSTGPADS